MDAHKKQKITYCLFSPSIKSFLVERAWNITCTRAYHFLTEVHAPERHISQPSPSLYESRREKKKKPKQKSWDEGDGVAHYYHVSYFLSSWHKEKRKAWAMPWAMKLPQPNNSLSLARNCLSIDPMPMPNGGSGGLSGPPHTHFF